jgi:hypothetical protein
VAADYIQAFKYFAQAGDNGDEVAHKYRVLIAKRLSPDELAKAKKLVRAGQEAHRVQRK